MDKCQYRHLSYKAFVFRGICLLTISAAFIATEGLLATVGEHVRLEVNSLCAGKAALFANKKVSHQCG